MTFINGKTSLRAQYGKQKLKKQQFEVDYGVLYGFLVNSCDFDCFLLH